MNPKNFLKNWSSVSAAAAMLLGINRAEGNPPALPNTEEAKHPGIDPFEPLILKPAPAKIIPELLFAGHRSHSSHSSHSSHYSGTVADASHASHASHYSGTTGGAPYYRAPSYPVPNYPAPTPIPNRVVPRTYPPNPTSTPTPIPRAIPVDRPIRIELTNGAVIYGTVLAKSAAGITIRGLDEKNYKIPRVLLAANTISALQLPEPTIEVEK